MGRDKKEWYNNIGRIIKKKNGKFMLVFERAKNKDDEYIGESPFPLTINEGDILNAKLTAERLDYLVDEGKMKEETAEKIKKFEKFTIDIPPARDEDKDEEEKPKSSKSKSSDEKKSKPKKDDGDDF